MAVRHSNESNSRSRLTVTLGGFFRARLSFPPEYPLMPPKMKFETPIFHPNSASLGSIGCLLMLSF